MRIRLLAASLVLVAPLGAQTFFPAPPEPGGNPVTQPKALLGMALFWDEQLSSSNSVACGSCHQFAKGGADPRVGLHPGPDLLFGTGDEVRASPGVRARNAQGELQPARPFGLAPQVTSRKAPSVVNAAYSSKLFYDGRARDGAFLDPQTHLPMLTGPVALENLALQPIFDPVEMGHPARHRTEVVDKISNARPLALATDLPPRLETFVAGRSYPELFRQAFGTRSVTTARIAMALATYMRTLVSDETPFDRHVAGIQPMDPAAVRGMEVFDRTGAAAACSQCHGDISAQSHQVGPVFELTTSFVTPTGHENFHHTGVRPFLEDAGRYWATLNMNDRGKFKVPLLRNVALRAPFFHNGGMRSLGEVVDFYDRGGDFHVNQAPGIQPRNLTAQEKSDLVAFLEALTDPRVANELPPFDRPTLSSEASYDGPSRTYGTGMVSASRKLVRSLVIADAVLGQQDYELAATGMEPGQQAFILWDAMLRTRDVTMFGLRLRVLLSPWTTIMPAGSSTISAGVNYARATIAIPRDPAFLGLESFGQWVVTDSASPVGLVTSDAFRLVLR